MTDTCPTVRVVSPESPGGFKVINESDLVPGHHELWNDEDESVGQNGRIKSESESVADVEQSLNVELRGSRKRR